MDLKNNNKGIRNKSSCGVPVVAETSWAMLQPLWGPKKWEVRGGTKHYSAKCTLLEWADSYSFLTDQINLVAITSVKWNQRKKNVFSQVIIMQCDKALDCRRKREFWIRGSSWPRDWTHISWGSCIAGRCCFFFFSFNGWATGEVLPFSIPPSIPFKQKSTFLIFTNW